MIRQRGMLCPDGSSRKRKVNSGSKVSCSVHCRLLPHHTYDAQDSLEVKVLGLSIFSSYVECCKHQFILY